MFELFKYQTLWLKCRCYLPLVVLNPKYYIDIIFTPIRWLMGALYMLGYLGTILLDPLFGNSGRYLYPLIHLNLGMKVLIVFGVQSLC
jgi:hypothetical protein